MPTKKKTSQSVKPFVPMDDILDQCLDGMMDSSPDAVFNGVSAIIHAGVELTKVIADCEQKQNIKLDRKEILKIYVESMTTIAKTMDHQV